MKLNSVKIDAARADAGQWFDAGKFEPRMRGMRLKVRAFGNVDDQAVSRRERDALSVHERLPGSTAAQAAATRILNARLSEAILTGWEGIEDEDGAPLPFSAEKALEILGDPDFRLFRDTVVVIAELASQGHAEALEADAKN